MRKSGLKSNDEQTYGSKGRVDESEGDGLSLSKISKDEIERMRRMRHIYIGKKCVEDEVTPSSEAEPTRTCHVSRALNEQQLDESPINDLPTPLNQKIVSQ